MQFVLLSSFSSIINLSATRDTIVTEIDDDTVGTVDPIWPCATTVWLSQRLELRQQSLDWSRRRLHPNICAPLPVSSRAYSGLVYNKSRSLSIPSEWILQPSHTQISLASADSKTGSTIGRTRGGRRTPVPTAPEEEDHVSTANDL